MSDMVTENTPPMPDVLRALKGISLIIAALMIIGAVYYYFVPVHVNTQNGAFGCGAASNPPSPEKDGFQYGPCQETAIVNLYRTFALVAGAVVLVAGSFLLLRGPRDDEWDDDVELGGNRGDGPLRGASARDHGPDEGDDWTRREDDMRPGSGQGWGEPRRRSRDQELLDDELPEYPSRRRRRRDDDF